MKDTDYVTIGVELTVPKMDQEQYIANRCQSALRNAQAICALLQASAVPSVTDLELLADLYVQMYQAQALADFADVGGYLLPRCKKALRGMGVEIVEGYTPEKEHLFDVTQAPGYGKNIVVRPALVMKDGTDVLSRGEYVRGL